MRRARGQSEEEEAAEEEVSLSSSAVPSRVRADEEDGKQEEEETSGERKAAAAPTREGSSSSVALVAVPSTSSIAEENGAGSVAAGEGDESPSGSSSPSASSSSQAAERAGLPRGGSSASLQQQQQQQEEEHEHETENRFYVACRVRPFLETEDGHLCVVDVEGRDCILQSPDDPNHWDEFRFDHCFSSLPVSSEGDGRGAPRSPLPVNETGSQLSVFDELGHAMLDYVFLGYHTTLVAYGQVASGKSFTVHGEDDGSLAHEAVGMSGRLVSAMLEQAEAAEADLQSAARARSARALDGAELSRFAVSMTMVEVYKDEVRDLLHPRAAASGSLPAAHAPVEDDPLTGTPSLRDCTEVPVRDYADFVDALEGASGARTRSHASRGSAVSQSHSVLTLRLRETSYQPRPGGRPGRVKLARGSTTLTEIRLVDLAGVERLPAISTAEERQELSEVYSGLKTLKKCFRKMQQGGPEAFADLPADRSAITQLLRPSLELHPRMRTFFVATLSPSEEHYEESLNTLAYAARVRDIPPRTVEPFSPPAAAPRGADGFGDDDDGGEGDEATAESSGPAADLHPRSVADLTANVGEEAPFDAEETELDDDEDGEGGAGDSLGPGTPPDARRRRRIRPPDSPDSWSSAVAGARGARSASDEPATPPTPGFGRPSFVQPAAGPASSVSSGWGGMYRHGRSPSNALAGASSGWSVPRLMDAIDADRVMLAKLRSDADTADLDIRGARRALDQAGDQVDTLLRQSVAAQERSREAQDAVDGVLAVVQNAMGFMAVGEASIAIKTAIRDERRGGGAGAAAASRLDDARMAAEANELARQLPVLGAPQRANQQQQGGAEGGGGGGAAAAAAAAPAVPLKVMRLLGFDEKTIKEAMIKEGITSSPPKPVQQQQEHHAARNGTAAAPVAAGGPRGGSAGAGRFGPAERAAAAAAAAADAAAGSGGVVAAAHDPGSGGGGSGVAGVAGGEQDGDALDALTPRARKAENLRREILASEKSYLGSLWVLMSEFVRPLLSRTRELGVRDSQAKALFGNVESIVNLHTLMYRDLREGQAIGKVFCKHAPFMRMYMDYVSQYDVALDTLDSLRRNAKFSRWLNEVRDGTGGLRLGAFLIMPVQRIPRYEMLLGKLRKATPRESEEHARLAKALALVRQVAVEVNEKKRHGENLSQLLSMSASVARLVKTMMRPTRSIVRHGLLTRRKREKSKQYLFVLFTDVIIWCSASSFRYKGLIHLAGADVYNFDSDPTAFELTDANGAMLLCASSRQAKQLWMADTSDCIQLARLRHRDLAAPDRPGGGGGDGSAGAVGGTEAPGQGRQQRQQQQQQGNRGAAYRSLPAAPGGSGDPVQRPQVGEARHRSRVISREINALEAGGRRAGAGVSGVGREVGAPSGPAAGAWASPVRGREPDSPPPPPPPRAAEPASPLPPPPPARGPGSREHDAYLESFFAAKGRR